MQIAGPVDMDYGPEEEERKIEVGMANALVADIQLVVAVEDIHPAAEGDSPAADMAAAVLEGSSQT